MYTEQWKKLLQQTKEDYYKIGPIPCPAFVDEHVHFNKYGFKHLMRKGTSLRDIEERHRRMLLISVAINILTTSTTYDQYRKTERRSWSNGSISIVEFWSFISIHNGKQVTVVVRSKNAGKKHFFSVM